MFLSLYTRKNNIIRRSLTFLLMAIIVIFLNQCSKKSPDEIDSVKKESANPSTKTKQKINQDDEIAQQIINETVKNKHGYQWLRELTAIPNRLSGSAGSIQAIKWAEKKMRDLGFDKVNLQPVMVPHWTRGNVELAVLKTSQDKQEKTLNIAALGGSIGTSSKITAKIIEVSSFHELYKKADQVKGNIVFFNYPMRHNLDNMIQAYNDAVKFRYAGAIEAAKPGGVAVLIRSITTKQDNVPHTGVMAYDAAVKKIPAAALGLKDADYLSQAVKKDPDMQLSLSLSCKTLADVQSFNVIAELSGSEKPEEVVILAAHLDSWDKGQGAQDDAGGCVQMIEALYLFKRLNIKPKRTIRCVLFANEENGLRGAKEYDKYALASSEKHIAAIESDLGVSQPLGFTVGSMDHVLYQMQKWLPLLKRSGILWIRKGFGGMDIAEINGLKAYIGYYPEVQSYFDYHHSENDVFETVNVKELQLGTSAIAILAYLISEHGL